jgi:hypothetical protein
MEAGGTDMGMGAGASAGRDGIAPRVTLGTRGRRVPRPSEDKLPLLREIKAPLPPPPLL